VRNGSWSDDELLRTLAFYASLSIDEKIHLPKADVDDLVSRLPRRTKGSVLMRISNFVARDPQMAALGIKGLYGGGAHVDAMWERFSDDSGTLDVAKILRSSSQQL
jgi:hypothetical protein